MLFVFQFKIEPSSKQMCRKTNDSRLLPWRILLSPLTVLPATHRPLIDDLV